MVALVSSHRLYGTIEKFTEVGDGTLVVDGIASTETIDAQGEIVTAAAMTAALPDYMKFANVREMHQAIAAGTALACWVDDKITRISAHVVDPVSCLKVRTKVLRGYSIGGSVPQGGRNAKNPKIIEAIKLSEISLVDRPANPDAVFTLVKLDQEAPVATPANLAEAAGAAAAAAVQTSAAPIPSTTITAFATDPGHASTPPSRSGGTGKPEETTEKVAAPAQPLRKGMYTIAAAAELLQGLANLQRDTAWEASYEGDASPLPAKLKAIAAAFAGVLGEMVGEETAELVAGLNNGTMVVQLAAKTGDVAKTVANIVHGEHDKCPDSSEKVPLCASCALVTKGLLAGRAADPVAKAGKRFSKATRDALAAVHKAIQGCDKGMADLKYADDEGDSDGGDNVESAAATGDLAKAEATAKTAAEELKKAEEATKLAGEALAKVLAEREAFAKALDATKSELAEANAKLATKGCLRVVPVEKKDDHAGAATTPDTAFELTKAIHAQGGHRIR